MSRLSVFSELEHVLLPEFGDLILQIPCSRWVPEEQKMQEQIPRCAPFLHQGKRDDSGQRSGNSERNERFLRMRSDAAQLRCAWLDA
jgi:hypothetical protein